MTLTVRSAEPTVRWAPGRVNLIGEHTDYNEGFVLPLAIAAGCSATVVDVQAPTRLVFSSAQLSAAVEIDLAQLRPDADWTRAQARAWATYPAGVLAALAHDGADVGGLHIHIDSDVPLGAGLSSSAALTCAVAAAVTAHLGYPATPHDLVRLARAAENDFVGAPTGGMDQLVSVNGQRGHVLLCDMRTLQVEPVPFDPDATGHVLLVVDTRAPHRLVSGEYAARRAACAQAAEVLGIPALRDVADLDSALARLDSDLLRRRVRHVVTENQRVLHCAELLRAGNLVEVGPILSASHDSMRDDYEITVPEIDLCQQTLLEHGALGARMTGGGFGGCVIALIHDCHVDAACIAVRRVFADAGYTTPDFRIDTAGPGVAHTGAQR